VGTSFPNLKLRIYITAAYILRREFHIYNYTNKIGTFVYYVRIGNKVPNVYLNFFLRYADFMSHSHITFYIPFYIRTLAVYCNTILGMLTCSEV